MLLQVSKGLQLLQYLILKYSFDRIVKRKYCEALCVLVWSEKKPPTLKVMIAFLRRLE